MSSSKNDDFEHSLIIGEKAFSSLIQDAVPVFPEMYEVLYAYEAKQNSGVVSAIEELKNDDNQLQLDDLQKIHDSHLSSAKLFDVSEDVGSKINDEIRKIIEVMNAAGNKSNECDMALKKIETKFSSVTSPAQLQSVVEILSNITRSMADNNQNLNSKLKRSSQQIEVLHHDLEQARNESNTDALTGLANRKKFDSELRKYFKIFDEGEEENDLCLLLVDIDHFKNFNDTYGHQTGDQILRLVAQTLKMGLKGRDLPARYGGEEFGIVLPNTTVENSFTVAEQIREAIAAKELIKRSTGENLGRLTVSIGIARALEGDTPASLIGRSDKALYKAKDTGRNLCVIAPDGDDEETSKITE